MRVRIRVVEFETHLQAYCVWPATTVQAVLAECHTSRREEFLGYWRRIAADGESRQPTTDEFEYVRNIEPRWEAEPKGLWNQFADAIEAVMFRRNRKEIECFERAEQAAGGLTDEARLTAVLFPEKEIKR